MGGKKRAKQFFHQHTNSASKKCWEKNRRKKCEKRFLYSHKYRYQKMGGKTRETIFPETENSAIKNVRKKILGKSSKNVFLYSHEYRDQKMGGGKTRETIFP